MRRMSAPFREVPREVSGCSSERKDDFQKCKCAACVRLHMCLISPHALIGFMLVCVYLLLPPLVFVHIGDIMSICAAVCEPNFVFTYDSAVHVCSLCICLCVCLRV